MWLLVAGDAPYWLAGPRLLPLAGRHAVRMERVVGPVWLFLRTPPESCVDFLPELTPEEEAGEDLVGRSLWAMNAQVRTQRKNI